MSARSPEEAYRALRRLARADGRTTQQAFELYVHERFLARLANSRFAERLVLKGGMLLAALDARRATRDADMLARGIDNDMENLRDVVSEIAAIELTDGVGFDVERISLVTIREDAKYEGIRVVVPASLGGAVLKLRLDLSFGDLVDPQRIDYPTLLDDAVISLLGYPLENVIAEKAETMMALGDANTRDRDYGDVYLLSGSYALEGESLWDALQVVTEHRGRETRQLGPLLCDATGKSPAAMGSVLRPRWPLCTARALRRGCRRGGRVPRRPSGGRRLLLGSAPASLGIANRTVG